MQQACLRMSDYSFTSEMFDNLGEMLRGIKIEKAMIVRGVC